MRPMAPKNKTIPGLSTKVLGTMACVGKTAFTSFSVRRFKICEAKGRFFFRELLLLKIYCDLPVR